MNNLENYALACQEIHNHKLMKKSTSNEYKDFKYISLDDLLNIVHLVLIRYDLVLHQRHAGEHLETIILSTNTGEEITKSSVKLPEISPMKNPLDFSNFASRDTYIRKSALLMTLNAFPKGEDKNVVGEEKTLVKETPVQKVVEKPVEKTGNSELDELISFAVSEMKSDKEALLNYGKTHSEKVLLEKLRTAKENFVNK